MVRSISGISIKINLTDLPRGVKEKKYACRNTKHMFSHQQEIHYTDTVD